MQELINRQNYLDVKKFLNHLIYHEKLKPISVSRYQSYIKHLLFWAMGTPFNQVSDIEPSFITYLKEYETNNAGKPLSRESWRKILGITVRFFEWAIDNEITKYPKSLRKYLTAFDIPKNVSDDIEVNYITNKEIRSIAKLEIPNENLALKRDRAAACFLYCSGMRVGAFVTMPIMAFDTENLEIRQWKKLGVETKNGKQLISFLFPITELINIIMDWDEIVRNKLHPTDLWYPRFDNYWGEHRFSLKPPGKHRAKSLNKSLKRLYEIAGIEYKSAHNFRRGNVVAGIERCNDLSTYKAISQNLGHANIVITDQYYARIRPFDRKEKITNLFKGT